MSAIRINWNDKSKPDRYIMEILRMFKNARMTRLDVAIDIKGMDFSKWTVTDTRSRSEAQYRGRDKKIETYYFGTRRSDTLIRIYNKAREQGLANYGDVDWWRVEAQD